MGHALALVHALGGCTVTLHDADAGVLTRAPGLIDAALKTLREGGAVTGADARATRARISPTPGLAAALSGADLVVEAVVEKPEVKRAVFADIDRHAPRDAILASNTSYLDIFPLVPEARRPRTAIAHWYTPPYIVDLVDLVPGPETRAGTVAMLHRLYRGFGKAPLVFERMIPGYIANRLQAALNLECLRMIDAGWVGAEAIDHSIRHGLALRLALLGHMRKMDFTGLEMVRNGLAGGTFDPAPATGRSATLDGLIARGRTGVAAGAGFYDYPGTDPAPHYRARDLNLLSLKTALADILGEDEDDRR